MEQTARTGLGGGAGGVQGYFSASINGVTVFSQALLTATYQHTTGCVYRAVDSQSLAFDLYLSDKSDTVTYHSARFSGTLYRR
jgi:hypothetical protein